MPSWIYWIIGLIVILILLWLFLGNERQPFIGLSRFYQKHLSGTIAESPEEPEKKIITMPQEPQEPPEPPKKEDSDPYRYSCPPIFYPPGLLDQKELKKYVTQLQKKMYLSPISKRSDFSSRGEYICCYILEKMFNKPFVKVRPDFLKNPETGRKLEIDCYNEELKIGLEYNGQTHSKWPNATAQSFEDFLKQIRRDEFKIEQCDEAGVYLITVPSSIPETMIGKYIEYFLPWNVKARENEKESGNS